MDIENRQLDNVNYQMKENGVVKLGFENGLRLIMKDFDQTAAVTVLVLVGAGSRFETVHINGISHFLEHMFFKGAEIYKNTKEVSEAIDRVGGEFNAFTGKEYAGYYVKVAADHLDLALNVLADMLINSRFDAVEINKERGVIMEEYNMYQDTPMYQIGWDFERLIYGEHPMSYDQVGTKEFISSVTREQFIDYKSKLYTPDNTVISIAGNLKGVDLAEKIQHLFKFKALKRSLDFVPFVEYSREKRLYLRNKKTEQAHVVVGYPGFSEKDEDLYALKLLSVILGGNMSSRMFLGVREEKGLAYYINTSIDEYSDSGTITTSSGVTVEKVEEAIQAIIEQYEKVSKYGVFEDELKKAKDFVKGKMVLKLEDSEEYAHLLGKFELVSGKLKTPEEIVRLIDKVSLEQANNVAKRFFLPEEMRIAIIGPYDEEEKFLKYLK